jgi:hypothetical protein
MAPLDNSCRTRKLGLILIFSYDIIPDGVVSCRTGKIIFRINRHYVPELAKYIRPKLARLSKMEKMFQ